MCVFDEGMPALSTAIRHGDLSWIQAFLEVGSKFVIENKPKYITVIDYALMHAPKKNLYDMLKFFNGNAVPITEGTKCLVHEEALGIITRNADGFLQWLADLQLLPQEPKEMTALIHEAAQRGHYKCLKV